MLSGNQQPSNVFEIDKGHLNSSMSNNDIMFCWLPSHIAIRGKCKADTSAEAALENSVSSSTFSIYGLKTCYLAICYKIGGSKAGIRKSLISFMTHKRRLGIMPLPT